MPSKYDDNSDEEVQRTIQEAKLQEQRKKELEAAFKLGDDDRDNSEDENKSEDEEEQQHYSARSLSKKNSLQRRDSPDSGSEDEDEDATFKESVTRQSGKVQKKRNHFDAFNEGESDEESDVEDDKQKNTIQATAAMAAQGKDDKDMLDEESYNLLNQQSSLYKDQNPEKISSSKLAKIEKKLQKTGVIYISKVPPYMKPSKMRQILSQFGKVDRLFLKPETHIQYQKRVKYGGNKKRMYVEGWAEFFNKKDAKLCVATLNGQKIGGKKGTFYYDDIMNIKYLKNFKWIDLTSQMAKENEAKQSKLMMEISNANKLNKAFIRNVEKSKMIDNMQKRKKQKESEKEDAN